MQFGTVLRKMRKGAGFSQEDLAERLHISRSNVSRLESDKLELKAADLIRWCKTTEAQDMMIALVYGVDVSMVTDALTGLVGTIILGGIF